MKMTTLIEALMLLRHVQSHDADAVREIDDSLLELMQLRKYVKQDISASVYDDACYVISASAACDLINIATYDIYGKLARVNCAVGEIHNTDTAIAARRSNLVKLADYKRDVQWLIDGIDGSILEDFFGFLDDLWTDNEQFGNNKPDGTFDHSN